jgi:hypothetical protein
MKCRQVREAVASTYLGESGTLKAKVINSGESSELMLVINEEQLNCDQSGDFTVG